MIWLKSYESRLWVKFLRTSKNKLNNICSFRYIRYQLHFCNSLLLEMIDIISTWPFEVFKLPLLMHHYQMVNFKTGLQPHPFLFWVILRYKVNFFSTNEELSPHYEPSPHYEEAIHWTGAKASIDTLIGAHLLLVEIRYPTSEFVNTSRYENGWGCNNIA